MTKEFILNKEQFLNGSNFDPRIKTALETRKLVKYINKDVIASIKENYPNDVEKLKKSWKEKLQSKIFNNQQYHRRCIWTCEESWKLIWGNEQT